METVKQINSSEDQVGIQYDVLVLGLGNSWMGDEGVGVHISQRMALMHLDHYIKVIDGGNDLSFMEHYLEEFHKIIFVDATNDGQPAGTVTHINPKKLTDFSSALAYHHDGVRNLLEKIFNMENPPQLHLVGISVDEVNPLQSGLSEVVEDSQDRAIWQVIDLAETLHLH